MVLADFFEVLTITAIASILLIALYWRLLVYKKQCLIKQRDSLSVNSVLKQILSSIQQHRGMVNATLNGDTSFTTKIPHIQKDINQTLRKLELMLKNNYLKSNLADFQSFKQEWNELYPQALSLSKGDSLKAHTTLIQSIIYLMTNVAEENQLLENNCYPIELVDIIWHRVPNTAEALGKIRAVGSGIAATGKCNAIDLVKVEFLIKSIKETLTIVEKSLKSLSQDANNDLVATYQLIQHDIYELVDILKYKILEPKTPLVTGAEFFDKSSICLSKVYDFFGKGEEIISKKIAATLIKTETGINVCIAIMVISLLTGIASLSVIS